MERYKEKAWVGLVAMFWVTLFAIVLGSGSCHAQPVPLPNTPEQEVFKLRADLKECETDLAKLVKAGDGIMKSKQSRIKKTETIARTRETRLKEGVQATQAENDSLVSVTIDQAAIIAKYAPKTRVGRWLYPIRKPLQLIGGVAVLVGAELIRQAVRK